MVSRQYVSLVINVSICCSSVSHCLQYNSKTIRFDFRSRRVDPSSRLRNALGPARRWTILGWGKFKTQRRCLLKHVVCQWILSSADTCLASLVTPSSPGYSSYCYILNTTHTHTFPAPVAASIPTSKYHSTDRIWYYSDSCYSRLISSFVLSFQISGRAQSLRFKQELSSDIGIMGMLG